VKRLEEAITSTLIMPQGQGQARNETMLKMLSRDEQRNDLDVDDYSSDNDIHTDGVQQLNISDQAVSNKDFNNLLVNYAFKACLESSANDFIDCVQLNFEEPESRPQHTEYSNKRQKRDVKNEFGGINANHHPHKRNGVNFEVSLEAGQGRDRETVQSADSIVIDSSQPASQSEAAVRVVNAGPKYTPRGTADATGEEEIFGSENDPGARERERGLLRDLASDIDFAKDEQLTSQVSDTSPLIRRILRARLLDNDVSLMASMLPGI
jgi:hypothetical protein